MSTENDRIITEITENDYKYGFVTDIETETIPKGLNEDVIRLISGKKTNRSGCWNFDLKLTVTG